jgi:hypothetical protein
MARGVVPISPATTAMADYIMDENAILLEATDGPVYESVATAYGLIDARWREVSASEVARGIEQASSHDANQLAAKREAAIRTVIDRYSPAAITPLVERRLAAIEKKPTPGCKSRVAEDMVVYSR